jgi:capsular polysaccharide biosynthesis protein/Mrp family chromosome partitioning ATPase
MNTSTKPDSWELADYGRVLRRRWRVVVALTCLGLLIAAAIVEIAPKKYKATASVYVYGLPTDSQPTKSGTTPVDMDNEAQIAQSHAVSRLAAQQLPAHELRSVTIAVPPNTTVLNIGCTSSTATRAAACANAVAAAYLTTRRANAANTLKGEVAALRSKGVSLLPAVVRAQLQQQAASTTTGSAKIARQLEARAANAQLNAVVSRTAFLNATLASLESPNSTLAGHLMNPAHPPASPSSPRKSLIIPSGLVAGLLVGLILAIWLEVRDDRLHDARDVERIYGLPTLLNIRGKGRKAGAELLTGSGSVRAFGELADYVATARTEGSFVVLVSGTSPEEGTSAVAANLAAALSDVRPEVFLVCAGPGVTLVPQLLGLQRRSGLTDLLAGDANIDGAAQVPGHLVDLRVIGPGANGPTPAARYDFDARRQLISDLRGQARYVIVEAPLTSGESGSPVLTLGEFADAAIVVVETPTLKRGDVDGLLRHLERIRVPVMGSAVIPRLDYAAGLQFPLGGQAAKPKLGKLAIRA